MNSSRRFGGEPFHFAEMEAAMTEGSIDLVKIKTLWNKIVDDNGATWDDKSFLRALQELSGWDEAQINLFGQIGFGTGGWNTDFPNSILNCCASSMAAWTPITGWPMTGPPACPSACGPCPRVRWATTWRTGPRAPAWKR